MFQEEQKAHVKVLRKKEAEAIHSKSKKALWLERRGGEAGQVHWDHGGGAFAPSGESGCSSSMLWGRCWGHSRQHTLACHV